MLLLLMGATVWSPRIERPAGERSGAGAELKGFVAMVAGGALVWWLASLLSWPVLAALKAGALGQLAAETLVMLLTGVGAVLVARKVGFPSFVGPWDAFFSRPHALAFLLLIVLYKLGDAFAASLSTSFLLRGVGSVRRKSVPSTRASGCWPPSWARCSAGPGCRHARSISR